MKLLEQPRNPGFDDGKCGLCEKDGIKEDDRCHGCGYLVCEACNTNLTLMGPHLIVEHEDSGESEDELPEDDDEL